MTQQFSQGVLRLVMSLDGKILGDWKSEEILLLLQSDAVKEIKVNIKPVILGGKHAMSLSGLATGFLSQELHFRLKGIKSAGNEAYLHYVKNLQKKDS